MNSVSETTPISTQILVRPRKATIPPDRFDFGVITVNPEEREAVRDVLGLDLRHPSSDDVGRAYYWSSIKIDGNAIAHVIHGETGDYKTDRAEKVAQSMIRFFDPTFILILGTAGGIGAKGCEMGQVVYSRLVRSSNNRGYIGGGVEFEEDGNIPPDERLINLADDVAYRNRWRAILGRMKKKPPIPGLSLPRPQRCEVFSGPDRHDDVNSSIFLAIKQFYPRVSALEMEAAEVANAVRPVLLGGRGVGYLMIKGISDIVDDNTPADERKARRKLWAPYASASSAAFAHSLIKAWKPDPSRFTTVPLRYQQPLQNMQVLRNEKALVIHRLHPEQYSELCGIYSSPENIQRIFTVCAFEPMYFIKRIAAVCDRPLEEVDHSEFLAISDGVFQHFGAFRNLSDQGFGVTRILLVPDSYESWLNRNNKAIELFARLNGSVECYVAETHRLREDNLHHMTDHVVFNANLWLDYYDEAQTLIMTYGQAGSVHQEFTAFERHFQRKKRTNMYRPLDGFLTRRVGADQ